MTFPAFDQLHVVSDLHLGGPPGFQIFNQGLRLAALITTLAKQSGNKRTGFVLNGDIVDFLAEAGEDKTYLDPLGAVTKLERIYDDKAFRMVWEALEEFLKRPHCHLILVLGNHDVELALPPVREWLLATLSGNDSAARGRVTFAVDGSGYACTVGGKRVLCLHGNEVDRWNLVNYRALLDVSQAMNRGDIPSEWDANAGTRLVIDAMNRIKKDFPMVDLLKPEREAALTVLAVLDPDRLENFGRFLRVIPYLSWDTLRHATGFLSAEDTAKTQEQQLPNEEEALVRLMSQHLQYSDTDQRDVASLLMQAYQRIEGRAGQTPPLDDDRLAFLGSSDRIKEWIRTHKEEALRKILRRWLQDDHTFDLQHKDEPFLELDKEIGPNVDYLIAGHTHLERAVERSYPGHYYFNSGTWIRLIRLSKELLEDSEQFHRVYEVFQQSMDHLDRLIIHGRNGQEHLITHKPTVVSIVYENGRTYGELGHAQEDGTIHAVEGSRFPGW